MQLMPQNYKRSLESVMKNDRLTNWETRGYGQISRYDLPKLNHEDIKKSQKVSSEKEQNNDAHTHLYYPKSY